MSWSFIAQQLSNSDVTKINTIYKMRLQDILDYMVIVHYQNVVDQIKNKKGK